MWLLLSSKTSFPTVGVLGLVGSSRWGGETALEVLGLGCSGELWANLASFSASDSILITFLGLSVWQDFLFCDVAVLENSCAVGSYRARSGCSRGPGVVGRDPDPGGRGLWMPPLLLRFPPLAAMQTTPCSIQKALPRCHARWACLLTTRLCRPDGPGSGSCSEQGTS